MSKKQGYLEESIFPFSFFERFFRYSFGFSFGMVAVFLMIFPQEPWARTPPKKCTSNYKAGDIVLVGDSISVGTFGAALSNSLKDLDSDRNVARYAVGSSSAKDWANGRIGRFNHSSTFCGSRDGEMPHAPPSQIPKFEKLMAGNPSAVVIALGTNDAGLYCRKNFKPQEMDSSVKKMIDMVPADSKCVWLGPLNYDTGVIARMCAKQGGKYSDFLKNLKQAVTGNDKCEYLDSSQLFSSSGEDAHCKGSNISPGSFSDKVHPGGESAKRWAGCAGSKIRSLLEKDGD